MTTQQDIYERLGIDPRASATLAQEVYWRRVNGYLEADRDGDPEARAAIAQLNEALEIVLDPARRLAYDSERTTVSRPSQLRSTYETRARKRSLAVAAMVPMLVFSLWAAASVSGPFAVVGVSLIGLSGMLAAARWANREVVEGHSPFAVLGLHDGATLEELQDAYATEAHRLLLRVRTDRHVVRDLQTLDDAYARAINLIARGDTATPPKTRSLRTVVGTLSRWTVGAFRGVARGLLEVGRGLIALVALLWRLSRRASSKRAQEAGKATRLAATAGVDVERRLESAFRDVAARIAGAPVETMPEERHSEQRASMVLESPAGNRHVPLGPVPLRVGADASCDLVLRQEGVRPEHALAWHRDDVVMLHAVDPRAICLVNGTPMTWAVLEDGDEVHLGDATLRISIHS